MKKRKLKKVTAMTCAFAVAAASGAVPVNASTTLANGWDQTWLDSRYTADNPFVFPTDGTVKTLEAELATEYFDVCGGSYALTLNTTTSGASNGRMVYNVERNGNNRDSLQYAYTAEKAGVYHVVVQFNSGSTSNGFKVSETNGKIVEKSVTAGANDGARALHTAEFDIMVTTPGAGTMVITAGDSSAPRLDKFDISLKQEIPAYTAETPFTFPNAAGTTATLEPEYGVLVDNTEGNTNRWGTWPMKIVGGTWCGNGYYVDAMNANDTVSIPYTVEKAGVYTGTVSYRSGSTANGIKWTDDSGNIEAGSVVAGASDSAGATHTAEFQITVNQAGSGTLVLSGITGNSAPRIDKIDLQLTTEYADLTELNAAVASAEEILNAQDKAKYSAETLAELQTLVDTAKAYTKTTAQSDIATAVSDIQAKVAEIRTTYTITASSDENGTISDAGASAVYKKTSKTYTFTPNDGYEVSAVTVDGEEKEVADSYTFENVTADHTIAVAFAKTALTEAKEALQSAIDTTEQKLQQTGYTAASIQKLQEAVETAKAALQAEGATADSLKEVKAALEAVELVKVADESLEVTAPTKTVYERGEELSTEGMVVTVKDNNGGSRTLEASEYTVEGFDSQTAGTKVITVKYGEFTATFEVTVNASYIVTVDGVEAARGQYGQWITLKAEEKEGKVFAGWAKGGKVVSTSAAYRFALAGDTALTTVYDEEVSVEASADMSNAFTLSKQNGRAKVRFVGQIVVPEGYKLEECGMLWTGKSTTTVPVMYTSDGTNLNVVSPAKKVVAANWSSTYQYSVTISNVPVGKTARGVIYAKVTKGAETKYVFSNESAVTAQ